MPVRHRNHRCLERSKIIYAPGQIELPLCGMTDTKWSVQSAPSQMVTRIVGKLCTAVSGFTGRIRLLRVVGRRPNPDMERLIPARVSSGRPKLAVQVQRPWGCDGHASDVARKRRGGGVLRDARAAAGVSSMCSAESPALVRARQDSQNRRGLALILGRSLG
jgi:hypothetical protein